MIFALPVIIALGAEGIFTRAPEPRWLPVPYMAAPF